MKTPKFIPLLVVAAGLLAYHDSFTCPFTFDDAPSIQENPTIRHLWPIWQALSPPAEGSLAVTARPIINLSLAINYALGGFNVWGYHALNLTVHILAGLALLGVVRRTLQQPGLRERYGGAANGLALAVAVLWIVHPLQTESVTCVFERTELIVGLFYLLTLYCFIRGAESPSAAIWYSLSVVACLLGMASKEVMVSAPLMVLLYDRTFLSGSFREAWRRRRLLYLALACTWIPLACLVMIAGTEGGMRGLGIEVAWWQYALIQLRAVVLYLRLAFWPHPLVLDYGPVLPHAAVGVSSPALIIAMLLVATGVSLWRWPAVGFLGAWFFAILAPSSSVVPLPGQAMAEHRMYLSLAAVVVLVVMGIHALFGRRTVAVVVVLAIGLGVLTWRRNQDYRGALAIWDDTVAKWPQNPRAHNNLGAALEPAGKMQEAIEQYEQALRITPDFADAHYNLGIALFRLGRVQEAIGHYEQALRIKPDHVKARNNLGLALVRLGRLQEAMGHWELALRSEPDYAEAHNNLGNGLLQIGKVEEAIEHYEQALRIKPDYAEAHDNLGVALLRLGRLQEAMRHWELALRIKPDYAEAHCNLGLVLKQTGSVQEAMGHYEQALRIKPDYPEAQNNLAWLLATLAPTEGGDPVRAVTLAERACELTNNRVAADLDTLAAAYAAAGRFNDAITTAQQAVGLARSAGQTQVVSEIETRLELYRAGRPYHESATVTSPHDP